ncbi:Major facilitator superfamily domain general substrate transporter [Penicillium cataractarum]|uniref:Major facilitator superfamily domain general substrate transporter n=1 Tax=Penicillium cataractarum TaxID=2100454 RepID=A0A9W9V6P7_9EURO|nr:Major facilitator superfamily domain general substrate transporter [Penicillium cataractarum]KAJ5370752.1 Major facilitator superfamily domain general substrate transporter [Penicillium cataractarum]
MSLHEEKEGVLSDALSSAPVPESDGSEVENQPPKEPATPPPPPNGGLTAWLQVAGAFFLFFNCWGVVNTFGVYQSYYEDTLLPDYSASSISWIGTVQGFLLLMAGAVVGPIYDKGYLTSLLAAGTFLVVFGLMMTSLATKYYQIFLAHGLVVGLGCSCLFLPSIAIVATYFTSRRALATGITASGGSIGSVIYPIMFHKLIGPVGFGWTTRIIAFVALGGLIFSIAVMKPRLPPPKQSRSLLDVSAFKEAPFLILCLAFFFSFIGLYFPFFYLPTYFTSFLHTDGSIAFYIIAILNAASVFGRIAPGILADHIGSLNTIIPISFIAAVLAFAWIGIRNEAGTIVFAILYGFASGAIVSLPATILARLTSNMSILGTRMGMSFTFAGLGLLIGNPIAGALRGVFWKGQLFSAVMVAVGTVSFCLLRILKWKQGEGWKI